MTLRISRHLLERLQAIAAADSAHEVCGMLLGGSEEIEAIVESPNVAVDPRVSFEIDPRVQIDAIKGARDGGPAVIGYYHSHPNGVARPSQWDADIAQPGDLWLILAGVHVTVWRRSVVHFQQLSLEMQ